MQNILTAIRDELGTVPEIHFYSTVDKIDK